MSWTLSNMKAAVRVLRCADPEIDNPEFMVASLEAYIESQDAKPSGPLHVWRTAVRDALADAQWEGDVDEILRHLQKAQALTYEPPDPLYPGAPVMALLVEDDAWHPAMLERVEDHRYHVLFTEYGKPQTCSKDEIVAMADVAEDEDDIGIGECEMCERTMNLTFHHLVPKETHRRYLKRHRLPANFRLSDSVTIPSGVVESKTRDKRSAPDTHHDDCKTKQELQVECSAQFLNSYGAMICRPCHSFVHAAETNAELAEHWNTVDLLRSHAKIQSWISYASKQKITYRLKP